MILPFEQWVASSGALRTDVCIIGGGAAGLEVAGQLARMGRRVLLLEGGAPRGLEPRAQRLQRVRCTGRPLRDEADARSGGGGSTVGRLNTATLCPRVLGGSLTAWAGRWQMPSPEIFSPRAWMEIPGWPLRWAEVEPLVREVARERRMEKALAPFATHPELERLGLERVPMMLEAVPPTTAAAMIEAAGAAGSIVIVTGANATELLPAPGGAGVGEVLVRGWEGPAVRVAAERFVLATGAIETARLLLHSTRFGGCGPGNRHGWVGRGFMERPAVKLGRLFPSARAVSTGLLATRRGMGRCHRLAAARAAGLSVPAHVLELRALEERGTWQRLLHGPAVHEMGLFLEQPPQAGNRVELDAERDELGVPIARVHWQPAAGEEEALRRLAAWLREVLSPRYGRVDIDEAALGCAAWRPQGRHFGTARMASSSEQGVVDPDGRVFGVGNLFVAGPAIFPSTAATEPMLLALALARRLARHLAG